MTGKHLNNVHESGQTNSYSGPCYFVIRPSASRGSISDQQLLRKRRGRCLRVPPCNLHPTLAHSRLRGFCFLGWETAGTSTYVRPRGEGIPQLTFRACASTTWAGRRTRWPSTRMALPEKSHPLFLESGRVVFGFSHSACFQDTSISPKDEGMTLGGAISALQVKLGSLQGGPRARLGRPNY